MTRAHLEDLHRQLARRRQDERAEAIVRAPLLLLEPLEQRYQEGERFAAEPRSDPTWPLRAHLPVRAAPRTSRPSSACRSDWRWMGVQVV